MLLSRFAVIFPYGQLKRTNYKEHVNEKTCNFYRTFFYILGCIFLAFGITLSTKTGLGVSPIISVPFAIASIWKLNFAAMTFLVYSVLVGIEFILRRPDYHWADLLQIPFSLVFSLLLNFFGNILTMNYSQLWPNLFLLFVAIVFTGIGAAMMVNMNFIPNPADGLAHTVGEVSKKGHGAWKKYYRFFQCWNQLPHRVDFYTSVDWNRNRHHNCNDRRRTGNCYF